MPPPRSGKQRRRTGKPSKGVSNTQDGIGEERKDSRGSDTFHPIGGIFANFKRNECYEIASGRKDVLSVWREMTMEEKKQLISVEEQSLLAVLHRMTHGKMSFAGVPSTSTVMWVQALFLSAMETNNGVIARLEEVTVEVLCILIALEERLLFAIVKRQLHRKSAFVLMFFIWRSRFPWIGFLAIGFVTLSKMEQCVTLRRSLCALTEAFFIHDNDPLKVEWKSHSFITGLLLLWLATGTPSYIIIGILTALPYVICAIESSTTLSGNMADRVALEKIRNVFSCINKLVLVYYSINSYSSLLLVALLFYADIAIYLFSLTFMAVGMVIACCTTLLQRIVPRSWHLKYWQWYQQGYNATILALVPLPIAFATVVSTWNWNAPWGGLIRAIVVMVLVQVLPSKILSIACQLALLALAIPLHFIQLFSKYLPLWIPKWLNQVWPNGQKCNNRAYDFDYEAYMKHQQSSSKFASQQ